MKKITLFKASAVACFMAFVFNANAGLPFYEEFSYTAGAALPTGGTNADWQNYEGTTSQIDATSLTYSGYMSPVAGGSLNLNTTGSVWHYLAQPDGNVTDEVYYASFLINISAITRPSEVETSVNKLPIFAFGNNTKTQGAWDGSGQRGVVYVKRDAVDASKIAFGCNKAFCSGVNVEWTPAIYNLNTTYLVVARIAVVNGANNDVMSIIVNPTLGNTVPTGWTVSPDASADGGKWSFCGGVNFIQPSYMFGSGFVCTAKVDGLIVSHNWADVGGLNPATSISSNLAPATVKVRNISGKLFVDTEAGKTIELYNSLGQKISSSISVEGLNAMNVNSKGLVVVKVGNQTTKVIL
ncbi:MAG: hypothetical protein PHV20_03660 [Bacteroidales bacterium]|nr:hypothetical protein [Bacteroidales bacterium]